MKPPKNVRKAVRSFLGVKKRDTSNRVDRDTPINYRTNLEKSRKKFGSVDHLNRGRIDNRFLANPVPSNLGQRSMSLPPARKNEIDNFNDVNVRDNFAFFENDDVDLGERSISCNSTKLVGRSKSLSHQDGLKGNESWRGFKNNFRHSSFCGELLDSHATDHKETKPFRDSGMFDLYVNEDIPSDNPRTHSKFYHKNLMSEPRSKTLPKTTSFSHRGIRNPRTTSQVSNASERLLSCMSALDHLEKKLANVSSDQDKMGQVTGRTTSQSTLQSDFSRPVDDWEIGGEDIRSSEVMTVTSRNRNRSVESSSTDSGITSNTEWGCSNEQNPPSRPRRSKCKQMTQKQEMSNRQLWTAETKPGSKHHLRSDSTSSGYSSGSGGIHQPALHYNYPSHAGFPDDSDSVMSVYSGAGEHHYHGFEYDQQYGNQFTEEDPYGYGSYAYPPSSIYEDEMHEHNGWFYLPAAAHEGHFSPSVQNVSTLSPSLQYFANDTFVQYPYYPSQDANEQMALSTGAWSRKYGSLNETFLDPSIYASPLAQAISSTCTETGSCTSDISMSDVRKYGSFRYKNGEKTVLLPPNSESRRRKTVRFSKTVNQRVEHCDSEVEDSTSVIKGCSGEEHYDIPKAWKVKELDHIADMDGKATSCDPLSEPIYEFPTGHIENSCMCSDCQLARSSCQLQVPPIYPYY